MHEPSLLTGAAGIGLALLRLESVEKEAALLVGDTAIKPLTPDWMRLTD